jgi:hypothetical protein
MDMAAIKAKKRGMRPADLGRDEKWRQGEVQRLSNVRETAQDTYDLVHVTQHGNSISNQILDRGTLAKIKMMITKLQKTRHKGEYMFSYADQKHSVGQKWIDGTTLMGEDVAGTVAGAIKKGISIISKPKKPTTTNTSGGVRGYSPSVSEDIPGVTSAVKRVVRPLTQAPGSNNARDGYGERPQGFGGYGSHSNTQAGETSGVRGMRSGDTPRPGINRYTSAPAPRMVGSAMSSTAVRNTSTVSNSGAKSSPVFQKPNTAAKANPTSQSVNTAPKTSQQYRPSGTPSPSMVASAQRRQAAGVSPRPTDAQSQSHGRAVAAAQSGGNQVAQRTNPNPPHAGTMNPRVVKPTGPAIAGVTPTKRPAPSMAGGGAAGGPKFGAADPSVATKHSMARAEISRTGIAQGSPGGAAKAAVTGAMRNKGAMAAPKPAVTAAKTPKPQTKAMKPAQHQGRGAQLAALKPGAGGGWSGAKSRDDDFGSIKNRAGGPLMSDNQLDGYSLQESVLNNILNPKYKRKILNKE